MCVVTLAIILASVPASAKAGTGYVDGISDQSLPAWDGSFAGSSFASFFHQTWVGQITLARYVVQWNTMAELSTGPNADGDYRERLEAWLQDVRSLGLTPVLALTSYSHVQPEVAAEYELRLAQLLDRAARMDEPIGYVESWNEPNNQGEETPAKAGEIADWAHSVCEQNQCQVIAGDLEDRASVAEYAHAYIAALNFSPEIWGIHPYYSVKAHSDSRVLEFEQALPNHGADAQIWFTEVGAYYCIDGDVRGEAEQASDASYLVNTLIPAIAPTHVFYYGLMAGGGTEVPCAAGGDDDTELYRASDRPRAAAAVILRADAERLLFFGSGLAEEPLAFASGS